MECTKLYPKMHAVHLGHLFYILSTHHPDTARAFFGPGVCVCVCVVCVCSVCVCVCSVCSV